MSTYDWKNRKVAIYLTPADLIYLTTTTYKGEVRVAKAPVAGGEDAGATRSLTLREGDGGNWVMTVASSGGAAATSEASVTLALHELALLRHLMHASVVWLSGWMYQLDGRAFDPTINIATDGAWGSGGAGGGGAAPGGGGDAGSS